MRGVYAYGVLQIQNEAASVQHGGHLAFDDVALFVWLSLTRVCAFDDVALFVWLPSPCALTRVCAFVLPQYVTA